MSQLANDVSQIRQRLNKLLQIRGYSACGEALALLVDHFTSSTKYESIEDFIIKLNRVITFETDANTSIINADLAHLIIKKESTPQINIEDVDVNDNDDLMANKPLIVKVKNVEYHQKQAGEDFKNKPQGGERGNDFNIHYNFLLKRLEALPVFKEGVTLTRLETLTGSSQPTIRCICFGLLIKDISKINSYLLIDSTGRVPVRITPDTTFRNKLAYTNCIVLVEGVYVNPDDVLFAANIGLPPILLDPLQDKQLASCDEKMIVILRELYMDDPDVCKYVDMLFTGYNSMDEPPTVFILIGDFTRECYKSTSELRSHTKKLVRIIRTCDNLKESHFVFVPGPCDSSGPDDSPKERALMPKQPLSKEQLPFDLLHLSNFNNVHLATNPTHIYLGERQISVVGHSYLKELPKNLLHDLTYHNDEFFENAKHIILSNAHLSAGASRFYQGPMNLWHRPDLLVLADTGAFGKKFDYSSSKPDDTTFTTMPSFSRQFSQFKVYYLKSGEVEESEVSPEAMEQIIEDDGDDEDEEQDNVQLTERSSSHESDLDE